MSSTRLSALLDGILEACWLAAIIVTPLFFNIYSSRVFEPDKLTTLRSIALVMVAVWLIRLVEEVANRWAGNGPVKGEPLVRFTWRTPLVLVTLFTAAVYVVSNILSVTPLVSFVGSYQRLQGTFTTLSYMVVFFIILDRMRTRAQVDRFFTTLIINSLPIALYGFVQHSALDPLPWGGDVTRRIASNMGNAIFVAAYLIMIVPPTISRVMDSFRAILTDEDTGLADILRAAAYIFILLVQIIAIWYTKSRGPLVGLVVGLGLWVLLGLLSMQRAARTDENLARRDLFADLGRGFLFGLGSVAAAGVGGGLLFFISRAVVEQGSDLPQWIGLFGGGLVMLGVWLAFIVNGQGQRWMWSSALFLAIGLVALFLVINLVDPIHEWSQEQPWLGRLDDVLQYESGTGKVRALIWEGALDMLLLHDPIVYPSTVTEPEAYPDPLNSLRPWVGYGPESMYVAYNSFYPPELAHYESRTASPDRSHNETLDSLIITGIVGFCAYVWLFGAVFYAGLRWLGFIPSDLRRTLFFVLLVAGAVAGVLFMNFAIGLHFFGLGVPFGMLAGVFIYLVVYLFTTYRKDEEVLKAHPYSALLVGVLSTFAAHFAEINFGISIASTRTTFWALAGVFVLLGLKKIAEQEIPAETTPEPKASERKDKKRRRRRAATASRRPQSTSALPSWLWPALGASLMGSLILGTLAYDFVNNVERLTNASRILWRSLTVIAIPANRDPRTSLGILMVFVMTWLSTALLTVAQMIKRGAFRGKKGEEIAGTLVVLTVSLSVAGLFALTLAERHATIVRTGTQTAQNANQALTLYLQLATYVSGQLTAYYVFLAATIVLGGLVFIGERVFPKRWITPAGAFGLLAAGVSWLVLAAMPAPEQEIALATGTLVTPWTVLTSHPLLLSFGIGILVAAGVGLLVYLYSSGAAQVIKATGRVWIGVVLVAFAVFVAPIVAYDLNLKPIQADVIYKQADPFDRQGVWNVAVPHYQLAVSMVPWEDFYYLYLGRALLENTSALEDPGQQALVLRQTEQVLLQAQAVNPLNTDHSANLARMYSRWAHLPAGRDQREFLGTVSADYYETATGLSPSNAILWNEWALLQYHTLGDEEGYQETINRSLQLDTEYANTWLMVGDVSVDQGDLEGAIEAYSRALDIQPRQARVWYALAQIYLQQANYPEAIEALSQFLTYAPNSNDAWDVHRLLAISYYQEGDIPQALIEAQLALQMAPEGQRQLVEELVLQLQQSMNEGTDQ
jgi:tetratricopeptide (TPR) repeat protein